MFNVLSTVFYMLIRVIDLLLGKRALSKSLYISSEKGSSMRGKMGLNSFLLE